jgi:hypothetical protein
LAQSLLNRGCNSFNALSVMTRRGAKGVPAGRAALG